MKLEIKEFDFEYRKKIVDIVRRFKVSKSLNPFDYKKQMYIIILS